MEKLAHNSGDQEIVSLAQGDESSTLNEFKSSFRTFSLDFDEWNFTHWWVFLFAFYLILGILIVLWDTHSSKDYHGFLCQNIAYYYVSTNFSCSLTAQITRDYPYHFFIIGQFLLLWLFNKWRKRIPRFFQDLQNKKIISSSEKATNLSGEYLKFLAEYQCNLLSKKRYIIVGSLFLATLIYYFLWWKIFGYQNTISIQIAQTYTNYSIPVYVSDPYLVAIDNIRSIWEVLFILLLCYFAATGGWLMFSTGLYIDKLTTRFKLNIRSSHPDKCGGLKLLGSFCLNMALIIILLAMFQSFYGLTYNPKSFWGLAAIDFMVPCTLVLAYLTFLVPLFGIHRQMADRKEKDEDEYANRINHLELSMRSKLDNGELDKAKIIKDEIETTQILNPGKASFQTWPFNTGILLTFFLPQIVPILSIIIPLINHG